MGLPFLTLFLIRSTPVFITEGFFFTKAPFLTFGGAYAVLAYIAQAGFEQFKWLTAPQMLDDLGLAENHSGTFDNGRPVYRLYGRVITPAASLHFGVDLSALW